MVIYELIEDRIEFSYKTSNNNETNMPYSVGGHPGFDLNLPIEKYRINFHSSFEADRWLIEKGCYSGQKQSMKIDCFLNLKDEYFTNDAIVFKNPKFTKVTLEKINAEQVVTLGSSSWEAIGFWTKHNAPFFCIEPWWGWADSQDSTGNIENKAGLHWLEPGQEEIVSYFIQIH